MKILNTDLYSLNNVDRIKLQELLILCFSKEECPLFPLESVDTSGFFYIIRERAVHSRCRTCKRPINKEGA